MSGWVKRATLIEERIEAVSGLVASRSRS